MEETNITSEILRRLREQKGVSQEVVSEACKISRVALARYENGSRFPKAEIVANLAQYYGVTSDYILGRESDPADPVDSLIISDRMKRLIQETEDLSDSEFELVRMFLKQVKKNRE